MRFSASLLLACLTLVQGRCYRGGEEWHSGREYAVTKARQVCELKFSIKKWAPHDAITGCYNLDSGRRMDITLERVSKEEEERAISADECFDGFQKEIRNCKHGGVSTYKNWKYR